MMRGAQVENGIVVGVYIVPSLNALAGVELVAIPDSAGVGWLWDGQIVTAPPKPRADYITQVKARAKQVRDGGTTISGVKIRADDAAIARITGAQVNPRAERKIITEAGSRVRMTQAQFNTLAVSVEAFTQAVMDKEYDLLELIDATADADLAALDLDSGWPE